MPTISRKALFLLLTTFIASSITHKASASMSSYVKAIGAGSAIACAMQNTQLDSKAGDEHAMHDAKTDADSANILKAKAQLEKTEADEDGLLDALGNVDGVSLIAQIAQDTKEHEEQTKKKEVQLKEPERKAALQAWKEDTKKSKKSIGFERFFELPYVLQHTILSNYCHETDPKYLYALRHKFELAPLLAPSYPRARVLLTSFHGEISSAKRSLESPVNRELIAQGYKLIGCSCFSALYDWMYLSARHNNDTKEYFLNHPIIARVADIFIFVYSDRTYEIMFNQKKFDECIRRYSLEQMQLLILLAQKTLDSSEEIIHLSYQDYETFQSLDQNTKALLFKYYPRIEMVMGIDERIDYWIDWVRSKIRALYTLKIIGRKK